MTIHIACPKCNAKYKVPDKFQGKMVKCQKCGASFKAATQTSAPAAAQRKAPQAKAGTQSEDLNQFGIDGPIVAQSQDIFDSPPPSGQVANMLGNHALDPGFSAGPGAAQEAPEPELSDLFINPAIEQQKPKKKKQVGSSGPKKKKAAPKKQSLMKEVWFLTLIILGPITLICTLVPLLAGAGWIWVGFVGLGLCGLAGAAIGVWGLILAYNTTGEALTLILCLFVPFYILYIIIRYWSDMAPYVFATLVLMVLQMMLVGSMVATGALEFLEKAAG